jgi:hypothetical protein
MCETLPLSLRRGSAETESRVAGSKTASIVEVVPRGGIVSGGGVAS